MTTPYDAFYLFTIHVDYYGLWNTPQRLSEAWESECSERLWAVVRLLLALALVCLFETTQTTTKVSRAGPLFRGLLSPECRLGGLLPDHFVSTCQFKIFATDRIHHMQCGRIQIGRSDNIATTKFNCGKRVDT